MRFSAMQLMVDNAKKAEGSLGKIVAASVIDAIVLNPHRNMAPTKMQVIDAAKLEENLKAGGFVVHDSSAVERHKSRALKKRARHAKGVKAPLFADHESLGKTGHYVMVTHATAEATVYDHDHEGILAHARSDTREDALLQAMRNALIEKK